MVKITLPPTYNNSVVLMLPDEYRGREIEVLLYAKDEVRIMPASEEKTQPVTMADFWGTMSHETAAILRAHTEQSRKE